MSSSSASRSRLIAAIAFAAGVVVGAGCSSDAWARFRSTMEEARRELLERDRGGVDGDAAPVLVRREATAGEGDARGIGGLSQCQTLLEAHGW